MVRLLNFSFLRCDTYLLSAKEINCQKQNSKSRPYLGKIILITPQCRPKPGSSTLITVSMPALKTISLHQQYDQEIAESSHCSQNERNKGRI